MAFAEKQVALVPAEERQIARVEDPFIIIERLATDPNVSIEKLERVVALLRDTEARRAKVAFNAAMAAAQKEMEPVAKDLNNPQTRSRYASFAALDRALRPIYTRHGLALTFNTADTPPGEQMVRVLCDVVHEGGHEKQYHIDMPADGKGAKGGDVMTRTHATGSAVSYGMRYLEKAIFAIAEADDDGNAAGKSGAAHADPPAGYDSWLTDMEATAEEGTPKLEATWKESKAEFRAFTVKHRRGEWERIKSNAARATRKAGEK